MTDVRNKPGHSVPERPCCASATSSLAHGKPLIYGFHVLLRSRTVPVTSARRRGHSRCGPGASTRSKACAGSSGSYGCGQ